MPTLFSARTYYSSSFTHCGPFKFNPLINVFKFGRFLKAGIKSNSSLSMIFHPPALFYQLETNFSRKQSIVKRSSSSKAASNYQFSLLMARVISGRRLTGSSGPMGKYSITELDPVALMRISASSRLLISCGFSKFTGPMNSSCSIIRIIPLTKSIT